jgi:hypothetical protein
MVTGKLYLVSCVSYLAFCICFLIRDSYLVPSGGRIEGPLTVGGMRAAVAKINGGEEGKRMVSI